MDDIWGAASRVPAPRFRAAWAAAFAVFIGVNAGAQAGLWGPTNAQVSAKYEVPLTPQGW